MTELQLIKKELKDIEHFLSQTQHISAGSFEFRNKALKRKDEINTILKHLEK